MLAGLNVRKQAALVAGILVRAVAIDEDRVYQPGEGADDRPAADLALGDEGGGKKRAERKISVQETWLVTTSAAMPSGIFRGTLPLTFTRTFTSRSTIP